MWCELVYNSSFLANLPDQPKLQLLQIAQTTMRSEIGKIELDKSFEERESLNTNIVTAINEAESVACFANRDALLNAIDIYEVLNGELVAFRRALALLSDGELRAHLSAVEIEECFDLDRHFANVDAIIDRALM